MFLSPKNEISKTADITSENEKAVVTMYPSMNSLEYYEEIYDKYKKTPKNESKAIIINHHLFAPEIIASTLESSSDKEAQSVIIISPDHFEAGKTTVTMCDGIWETPYGTFEADNQLAQKLIEVNGVSVDCGPFAEEHGIKNIIGFVKHAYPNAKVLPIILSENTLLTTINRLAEIISEGDSTVVGSFDFTHNESISTTRLQDAASLTILSKIDTAKYETVTVDSKKGILLLMEIAKSKKYSGFRPLFMTSASELVGSDSADNTSYITGYFY
jgi:poly-gamma-glutamate synthesis protein (capsule biosynthesis protein)